MKLLFRLLLGYLLIAGIEAQIVTLTLNDTQELAPTTSIYFDDMSGAPTPDIDAVANSSALILKTLGGYNMFFNFSGTAIQNLALAFNGVTIDFFASLGPVSYVYGGFAIFDVPTIFTVINMRSYPLEISWAIFQIAKT